jgi:hypothetical protein
MQASPALLYDFLPQNAHLHQINQINAWNNQFTSCHLKSVPARSVNAQDCSGGTWSASKCCWANIFGCPVWCFVTSDCVQDSESSGTLLKRQRHGPAITTNVIFVPSHSLAQPEIPEDGAPQEHNWIELCHGWRSIYWCSARDGQRDLTSLILWPPRLSTRPSQHVFVVSINSLHVITRPWRCHVHGSPFSSDRFLFDHSFFLSCYCVALTAKKLLRLLMYLTNRFHRIAAEARRESGNCVEDGGEVCQFVVILSLVLDWGYIEFMATPSQP